MKVLVAYASRHGATARIATEIGTELRRAGCDVEVKQIEAVGNIEDYDAFVLGSGVYYGRWIRSAVDFINAYEDRLASCPTWLFSSGPTGAMREAEAETVEITDLATRLHAREHVVFGGRLYHRELSLLERVVAGIVKAPQGDFRDWDRIREWAAEVAAELAGLAAGQNLEEVH